MDIRATETIQTWKQVSTGQHISIHHFCPWGMKNTMKKNLTADNCKSALNIASPVVQDYLSLTEKNFAKDDIIIDAHNAGMGRLTRYNRAYCDHCHKNLVPEVLKYELFQGI